MAEKIRIPVALTVHKQSRTLELEYDDGVTFHLPFEYLRVYSPSAEVRGHGSGQEVLQTGKRDVLLTAVEPAGNYALQLHFSDGHNSGLFTWDYLCHLATQQTALWADYLRRLDEAGYSEDSGRRPSDA